LINAISNKNNNNNDDENDEILNFFVGLIDSRDIQYLLNCLKLMRYSFKANQNLSSNLILSHKNATNVIEVYDGGSVSSLNVK
jgi:hypothetical protein